MLGCVRARQCAAIKLGRVFESGCAAHPGKSGGNQVLRISPRVTRLESARPFPGGDGASKTPATVVTFGTTGLTDPTLLCRTALTGYDSASYRVAPVR